MHLFFRECKARSHFTYVQPGLSLHSPLLYHFLSPKSSPMTSNRLKSTFIINKNSKIQTQQDTVKRNAHSLSLSCLCLPSQTMDLTLAQNKPWFLRVCSTSFFFFFFFLKTQWEKEKLLVTSNFFFSHSVFYP